MKYVMLIALLAAPVTYANDVENRRYCQGLGYLAYEFSLERDKGVGEWQMRAEVLNTRSDQWRKDMAMIAIDFIYERPYLSPEDEASSAHDACIETLLGGSI